MDSPERARWLLNRIQTDLKELGRVIDSLSDASMLDDLTLLQNRRYFRVRLEEELGRSERTLEGGSILHIGADHFLERMGALQNGDALLVELAHRLRGSARRSDVVVRLGGDRFGVLAPGAGASAAHRLAERLRRVVEEAPFADGKLSLQISIGIATYPRDGRRVDTLLQAAERAHGVAKAAGGNRVRSAAEGM